jgi:type VI secretion system protein ImpH
MFNHRFMLFFYRAWAQARPTASLDRPHDDRFTVYVGALEGMAGSKLRQRDAVGDLAKFYFTGLLARQVRNRDGLVALLTVYFCIPVHIEEFVGHWMNLPAHDRTELNGAGPNAQLGCGAVLGARVWDRQHKFRIWLGPLTLSQYESFLPGGRAIDELLTWVRQYSSLEFEWDVRLVLARAEVPKTRLGQFGRLGWTTWLGKRSSPTDAGDLTLDAEGLAAKQNAKQNPELVRGDRQH